ncbi:MAG: protein translocase subunit SecF [Candidatus Aenigmarchaeota archaeon]|nr:protein translocase subunit SecF [Candidatus Aenigmarchaeota archaeon]
MLIPILIFIICVAILFYRESTTGEFFAKSIELKGGTQTSIITNQAVNVDSLKNYLSQKYGDVEIRVASGIGGNSILIRASEDINQTQLLDDVKNYGIKVNSYSFEKIGAQLGKSFFAQTRIAFILAFIFMGIVVFIIFRTPAPSLAVIFAAFSDIICTLGIMQVIGLELSLASFAGLMMVLGYSIDTDILLTTRLLKRRHGTIIDRSISAVKTGLTMTMTTLVALSALYLASGARTLHEIATVLIIALLIDIPNTWLMNLGILRWWIDRKGLR